MKKENNNENNTDKENLHNENGDKDFETKTKDSNGLEEQEAVSQSLEEKIEELTSLNAKLQDQYLRKAADFDNYRKRMIKEKQEAIDYANTNLLEDLIKVLDDFDRAIGSSASIKEKSSESAFVEGVVMIRSQLGSMLESKYGLLYYSCKGELFDPNIHEAVASIPSDEVDEPTVSEEILKGYKLKDRVVRSAQVAVLMPKKDEQNK